MQEQGILIRSALVEELLEQKSDFKAVLGEFGTQFELEGKDGIRRKTEAPWVRLYSERMSPSLRESRFFS